MMQRFSTSEWGHSGSLEAILSVDDVEDAGDPSQRRDGEQREHEEEPPDTLHQQKLYVEVEAETRLHPTLYSLRHCHT